MQSNIRATSVVSSRVMDRHHPKPSQVDGKLMYRRDSTGQLVALLPARCKLGRHTLGHFEFRALVQDGEALIHCLACAADSTDHSWRLTSATSAPLRAELSEECYLALVRGRHQPALISSGGSDA